MTMHDPATIRRLYLLPTRGKNDQQKIAEIRKAAQTLCLDRSVLGMGWSVDADSDENISWEEYQARYVDQYRKKVNSNVRRWKEDVKIGDLIWTKMTKLNGKYFLAKVIGEWRYEPAVKFKKADMVNIREVEFVCVGNESHVPGRVVNSFIPSRTLQRIRNVDNLSRYLWNKHCPSTSPYEYIDADTDLFDILSSRDAEDVVYIRFQLRGYLCAPTRRQANTMSYEYLMWSRGGKCKLAVQVKTGDVLVSADNFPTDVTKIVLFSTTGNYAPTQDPRVTCLDRDKVISFIGSHLDALPPVIADAYRLWQTLRDRG